MRAAGGAARFETRRKTVVHRARGSTGGQLVAAYAELADTTLEGAGNGCHPNRETWVEVQRAGFETVDYDRITAPTPIVSPQIVGIAIKAVSPNNMGRADAIAGGSS